MPANTPPLASERKSVRYGTRRDVRRLPPFHRFLHKRIHKHLQAKCFGSHPFLLAKRPLLPLRGNSGHGALARKRTSRAEAAMIVKSRSRTAGGKADIALGFALDLSRPTYVRRPPIGTRDLLSRCDEAWPFYVDRKATWTPPSPRFLVPAQTLPKRGRDTVPPARPS